MFATEAVQAAVVMNQVAINFREPDRADPNPKAPARRKTSGEAADSLQVHQSRIVGPDLWRQVGRQ